MSPEHGGFGTVCVRGANSTWRFESAQIATVGGPLGSELGAIEDRRGNSCGKTHSRDTVVVVVVVVVVIVGTLLTHTHRHRREREDRDRGTRGAAMLIA